MADPEDDLSAFLDTLRGSPRDTSIAWRLLPAPVRRAENFTATDVGPTFAYMAAEVPKHVQGLIEYLRRPDEKANEDRATNYFREVFGEKFRRQTDAGLADGYVPGLFVLELKGKKGDWFKGLLQGLAYSRVLDFASVVVAAEGFLAVWRVDDIPADVRAAVAASVGAPSKVGSDLAARFKDRKVEIQKLAMWTLGPEYLDGGLFASKPSLLADRFRNFEKTLREGHRVREKITPRNFTKILKQMVEFFDPKQPIKAVRAFYSIIFGWDEGSKVLLSTKRSDQATVGGETIGHLVPERRDEFKEFVERHAVYLGKDEHYDDFFAQYDKALDTVDPAFRIKHGIFFTDLALSKFVLWLVKKSVGDVGQNHLVIDPACGSGNLVTNWRSPLELRHKVVSEIEPELLFAVERRMMGDQWHQGRYTVVPKVTENIGLNFLDKDAALYLDTLREYLKESGHDPNKPLAFLCNPPYRSDDDQTAEGAGYAIHPSITEITGLDASSERYCCFLAQMKLICEAAEDRGLPGDNVLLLFTKVAWLTDRAIFSRIRSSILGSFEDIGGIIVNGKEFFDVKGKFPVAFTMWRHKPGAKLRADRPIRLVDLTWMKRDQIAAIDWATEHGAKAGTELLEDARSREVSLGLPRLSMREWAGVSMLDFKRARRKNEEGSQICGGLPIGADQQENKKAYGESDGALVGFMDDRTPCRVRRGESGVPWFRLDNHVMDCRKSRCFSGPPDQKGYAARDLASADKFFLWFAIERDFALNKYPLTVDADELWAPNVPPKLVARVRQLVFAIGLADNECVVTKFPANNPVRGAPEVFVPNPMAPSDPDSFWNKHMRASFVTGGKDAAHRLVAAVEALYAHWATMFKKTPEIAVKLDKPYFIGTGFLRATSGISQIRDYANLKADTVLLDLLAKVQSALKEATSEFHELLIGAAGLDYFRTAAPGIAKAPVQAVMKVREPPPQPPALQAAEQTRSSRPPPKRR